MVVIFSAVPENSRYLQPIRNKTSPIPTRCAALSCASKKFSTECQRQSDIALSLLFFALARFVKLRPGLASLTPPMRFKTKINQDLGPVVRRPISTNPGLNFNLGFLIPLLKSLFGIIFSVLFKVSNSHTLD